LVGLVTPNSTSTAPGREHCWQECVSDLEQTLTCLRTVHTDPLYVRIQTLVPWCDRCFSVNGDCMGSSVPFAMYTSKSE